MQRPAFTTFAQCYLTALLKESGAVGLNQMLPRDPNLRVYKLPSRSNFETDLLSAAIGTWNQVSISTEVTAEAEVVDVIFEPHESVDYDALGWLGQLIKCPTIVQVLRSSPNARAVRSCLQHVLCWQAEASGSLVPADEQIGRDSQLNRQREAIQADDTKTLLMLVPSLNTHLVEGFGLERAPEYASGIYNFPPAFGMTVGVINQLPIQPSTLWLRLLGRGPRQRQAIEELMALTPDHPLRDPIVQQLRVWYWLLQTGRAGKESWRLTQTLAQLV